MLNSKPLWVCYHPLIQHDKIEKKKKQKKQNKENTQLGHVHFYSSLSKKQQQQHCESFAMPIYSCLSKQHCYNNIVNLLPHLLLFTFIETKIVYNTIVSFFFVPVSILFIETKIVHTTIVSFFFVPVSILFMFIRNNFNNSSIAQCQCDSSLSKQWYWESFAMLIRFMFIVSDRHLEFFVHTSSC